MANPIIKRVNLGDIRYQVEGDLDAVIASLEAMKREYEGNGFTDLEIDINAYDSYGSPSVDVELFGKRPETAEEAEKREQAARQREQQNQEYERRQYEALKAKFGDNA